MRWNMGGTNGVYDGTLRVQRDFTNTIASGDVYWTPPKIVFVPGGGFGGFGGFWGRGWPGGFRFEIVHPKPDPAAGIPVLPRARYRYYLRVTQILEFYTFGSGFQLGFERWRYDSTAKTFTNEGLFKAQMTWSTPPSGYPSGAQYLTGKVKDSSGSSVGDLTMGWVSPYYRKATLEVDRYSASEYPAGNGDSVTWKTVFDEVGWDLNAYESDTNLPEPSGQFWSDSELHARMLAKRDSADLDSEWRYHVLCVRRLDSTSRGIMYDAYGGDSNNVPREGAAISSHWKTPDDEMWGTVRDMRFGAATGPYFRTAVHEIGHAMGLYHNTVDTGFMNTTGTIAAAATPGTFPANVKWMFADDDLKRLRHMPDPWVRPGMISFGSSYGSVPISPNDQLVDAPGWKLSIEPRLECVPLGAPVRVEVTLTNAGRTPTPAPKSLSLRSGHVRGKVTDSAGNVRTFWPLVRCIEEHEVRTLEQDETISDSLTLLRGAQGALFSAPGIFTIEVEVALEGAGLQFGARAEARVMIEAPVTKSHSQAAMKVLSTPDTLLTLVLGGDHMEEGVAAVQAALADETLRPHFAWIEAKRLGRGSGERKADVKKALECVIEGAILSASEAGRLDEMLQSASAELKRSAGAKAAKGLLENYELPSKPKPDKKAASKSPKKPADKK